MGKEKTILRVANGFELNKVLLENLEKILGELSVERYSEQGDLQRSYKRRVNALSEAFLFILEALPFKTENKKIKIYLDWCKKQCLFLEEESVKKYQERLANFTAQLIAGLIDHCQWSAEENEAKHNLAINILNKAEQYVLMLQGRANLATLLCYGKDNHNELLLLIDKQLPACSEETVTELLAIKNNSVTTAPQWFRQLPSYTQLYLHSGKSPELIDALYIHWQKIKKQYAKTLDEDLYLICQEKEDKVPWFKALSKDFQQIIKWLFLPDVKKENINILLQEIKQQLQLNKKYIASQTGSELKKLPYWFLCLPHFEQSLLKKALEKCKNVEEINFLSSRLRTIPALANFAQHQLILLNEKGQIVKNTPTRLRLSHIASRDIINQPKEISELHCKRNLESLCFLAHGNPLLLQTLISPLPPLPAIGSMTPDYFLDNQLQRAISQLPKNYSDLIVSTNHPFNIARMINYTPSEDPSCLKIYKIAKNYSILFQLPGFEEKWELDQIRKFLEQAMFEFQHAIISESDDNQQLKKQLFALFESNLEKLTKWPNWSQAFANHLHHLARKETQPEQYSAYLATLADLDILAENYKALLDSGYGSATIFDYSGRELYLSSYENVLAMLMEWICSGCCVSGKDRKWIELSHTDAMMLYHEIYCCWPSFFDVGTARTRFIELVVLIYISRHGHAFAGQNALGSEGIKTPANYWPGDIATAIEKKLGENALKIDDILASNNEVAHIVKNANNLIKPGFSFHIISAEQLSEQHQRQLLQLLKTLVEEKNHWQKTIPYGEWINYIPYGNLFFKMAPEGICQFKEHLASENNIPSAQALATLYNVVSQRPAKHPNRDESTQMVYECLKILFQAENPNNYIKEVLLKLEQVKQLAFSNNLIL